MGFQISAFTLQKFGNDLLDNQDAFRPRLFPSRHPAAASERTSAQSIMCAAIADGASEGLLSDLWARCVAGAAIRQDFDHWNWERLWSDASGRWNRFQRRKLADGRALTGLPAWMEEPALAPGAFTTLAAISIAASGLWRAFAIGDSCLFHVQGGRVAAVWPYASSAQFSNQPYLLGSEKAANELLAAHAVSTAGTCQSGDLLVLATDAVAAWLLREMESGREISQTLQDLGTKDGAGFTSLVQAARARGEMRNDDSTLLKIQLT
jgi:hypothetical protein